MTAQTRKIAAPAKADSAAEAKPAKKSKAAKPEPTHRVIREIVIDGVPYAVGDLVALDGLNAAELESQGYVLKV